MKALKYEWKLSSACAAICIDHWNNAEKTGKIVFCKGDTFNGFQLQRTKKKVNEDHEKENSEDKIFEINKKKWL